MDSYRIGVLKGDGIGREIVPATVELLTAAADRVAPGVFDWVPLPIGWEAIERGGKPMPADTIAALRDCHGWIMGPDDGNSYPKHLSGSEHPGAGLRHAFELYANIRPSRNLPGIPAVARDADLGIVRENLEGLYPYGNMYYGVGFRQLSRDVPQIKFGSPEG